MEIKLANSFQDLLQRDMNDVFRKFCELASMQYGESRKRMADKRGAFAESITNNKPVEPISNGYMEEPIWYDPRSMERLRVQGDVIGSCTFSKMIPRVGDVVGTFRHQELDGVWIPPERSPDRSIKDKPLKERKKQLAKMLLRRLES